MPLPDLTDLPDWPKCTALICVALLCGGCLWVAAKRWLGRKLFPQINQ